MVDLNRQEAFTKYESMFYKSYVNLLQSIRGKTTGILLNLTLAFVFKRQLIVKLLTSIIV